MRWLRAGRPALMAAACCVAAAAHPLAPMQRVSVAQLLEAVDNGLGATPPLPGWSEATRRRLARSEASRYTAGALDGGERRDWRVGASGQPPHEVEASLVQALRSAPDASRNAARALQAQAARRYPCAEPAQAQADDAPAQTLRHHGLARCLARAATGARERADATATAAAYLERGDAPIAVYERMDALAAAHLQRCYAGQQPVHFHTMKCIDFMVSRELADTIGVGPTAPPPPPRPRTTPPKGPATRRPPTARGPAGRGRSAARTA